VLSAKKTRLFRQRVVKVNKKGGKGCKNKLIFINIKQKTRENFGYKNHLDFTKQIIYNILV
jgi:hypothetical protein